jgi:PTH2 family peptidyl-tRNA hydrolase
MLMPPQPKIDLTHTYIYIINEDLGMSKGKIAAQVAHIAVMMGCYWSEYDDDEGETKPLIGRNIILKAPEAYLRRIIANANEGEHLIVGQPVFYIEDAGLTEVPAGSLTCIGFTKDNCYTDKLTKNLKLV